MFKLSLGSEVQLGINTGYGPKIKEEATFLSELGKVVKSHHFPENGKALFPLDHNLMSAGDHPASGGGLRVVQRKIIGMQMLCADRYYSGNSLAKIQYAHAEVVIAREALRMMSGIDLPDGTTHVVSKIWATTSYWKTPFFLHELFRLSNQGHPITPEIIAESHRYTRDFYITVD